MERIKNLLLFLEKSNSEQGETLKEVLYLLEGLILEVNENLADQTAAAMKEQKSYKVDELQSEYKNNLKLLKQIKDVLNIKEKKEKKESRYSDMLKELNEPKTPPFLPNTYNLEKKFNNDTKKIKESSITEEDLKNKISDNNKIIHDLIKQISD